MEPTAVDHPVAREFEKVDESDDINGINLRHFPLFGNDSAAIAKPNLEMMYADYIDAGLQMAQANDNERRGPRAFPVANKTRFQTRCLKWGCLALVLFLFILIATIAVVYIKMSALEKLTQNTMLEPPKEILFAEVTTTVMTARTATTTTTVPITTTTTTTTTETKSYCPWTEGTDVLAHDPDTLDFRHAIIFYEWGRNPQDTGKFVHFFKSYGRWARIDWDDCGQKIRPFVGETPIKERERASESNCPYYGDEVVKVLSEHTIDDDHRPWRVVSRRGGGALILTRNQSGFWGRFKEPMFRLVLFSECPTILEKVD